MAATFIFTLGGLDLSSYLRVNPDDRMDPEGQPWVQPAFSETPFSDGQVLISTTVMNREQMWPLYLVDPTRLKDQLHALIRTINNAASQHPLLLEWRDSGASTSTFFDVSFVRLEPDFNFRRSVHGYAAGVLHVWTNGYGHTGTTRVTATAAGTGIFLSVPIGSVAGDAPALMVTQVTDGGVVPSIGRIIAVAPISNPSYTPRIGAASLTDLQVGATVIGASGADGSQYLALPVAPTGGASGIACKVPLPNPTIAGGDNRILAVVRSGIDSGVAVNAVDPYGNAMGATAVASMSNSWGVIDLGVCRLPTVGYPTQPKISLLAGAVWASGGAGPVILASPAGLALNEIFCLPDKNLTLLFEQTGSIMSKDSFPGLTALAGLNDLLGQPWDAAYNNAHQGSGAGPGGGFATGAGLFEVAGVLQAGGFAAGFQSGTLALIDADHITPILSDSMLIAGKVSFGSPGVGMEEVRLFKDVKAGQFVQARLAASGFLSLESATGGFAGNVLGSIAIATLAAGAKYVISLSVQGNAAIVNLAKDDGGPVFLRVAPSHVTQASVGVVSDPGVAGAGAPAVAMAVPSSGLLVGAKTLFSAWSVVALAATSLLPYDTYTVDGVTPDSYRTSSAGVFGGQKLTSVQRGAFPKMAPSTTSVAVIAAAFDQGVANDTISAVISVRERYVYGR